MPLTSVISPNTRSATVWPQRIQPSTFLPAASTNRKELDYARAKTLEWLRYRSKYHHTSRRLRIGHPGERFLVVDYEEPLTRGSGS